MFKKIKIVYSHIVKNKIRLWKILAIISMVLFFLAGVFIAWHVYSASKQSSKETPEIKKEVGNAVESCAGCTRRNIDGIYVPEAEANPALIAVMIDNHPDARPQFGLDKASVVYEAEVEGSYTRFMAIFAEKSNIEKIGPVRSARPYFIDWAEELKATYVHCGGSAQALTKIIDEKVDDLNEFYNGQYFWRSTDKTAPHNILTSSKNLDEYLEKRGDINNSIDLWQFKNDKKTEEITIKNPEITINFSDYNFKVKWVYNKDTNDYSRYYGESKFLTADKNPVTAKNIIIQTVPAKVIDKELRLSMETTGTGKAIICQDGECQDGLWKKDDKNSRTKFYYSADNEVKFNAGPSWIEVVRPEISINY